MPRSKGMVIGFWIVTALFCLQIGFTAYAQLRLPQVAEAFTHLGFPAYFRVELSWAKLLGVVLLLAPVPARLKEWAYAGFAIDLFSFFKGTSLKPVPPIGQFKDVRSLDVRESDKLDEKQLATWIEQAASIPGWDGGSPRSGGSPL